MLLQIIVSNGIPFELKKSSGSHRQVNVNVRRIVWNFAFALPCLAKRLKKMNKKSTNKKWHVCLPMKRNHFSTTKDKHKKEFHMLRLHAHTSLSVHPFCHIAYIFNPFAACEAICFNFRSEAHPKTRRCRGCGMMRHGFKKTSEKRWKQTNGVGTSIHSPEKEESLPLKIGKIPKRKGSSSNHPFSGVVFREGKFKENPRRVTSENLQIHGSKWHDVVYRGEWASTRGFLHASI